MIYTEYCLFKNEEERRVEEGLVVIQKEEVGHSVTLGGRRQDVTLGTDGDLQWGVGV